VIHLQRILATGMLAAMIAGCGQSTTFEMSDGESLVWEDLRGEWVFVNYWAEWCKPCFEEIPELNALDQESGVTVLGVNFDGEQGDALRRVMNDMGIEFGVFHEDPGPTFSWSMPLALPATMIVNPDGELVEARFGEQTKEELMQAMN